MNAFVKKEIRLLLPSFLMGIVAAAVLPSLPEGGQSVVGTLLYVIPFLLCPLLVVLVALQSFGTEVSLGTLAGLLAQPVEREKIWRVKTRLLAVSLLMLGLFWWAMFHLRFGLFNGWDSDSFLTALVFVWMMLAAIYSGALWTVLLLRQVAAAFWFTLLMPVALIVFGGYLFSLFSGDAEPSQLAQRFWICLTLGSYSLVGFWYARRLFFRAQDLQWTGGEIVMPEMRAGAGWFKKSATRRCLRPRAALWSKELWLHQSQLVIAGVLAAAHVGVLITRHFAHYPKNSTMEFITQNFWMLWLVMPVLVGCAAVAEERKLGTLEGQLCLPVRRRRQFFIKLAVALGLGIFLGLVMPLLMESARILPELKIAPSGSNVSVAAFFGPVTDSFVLAWTLQNIFNSLIWLMPFIVVVLACSLVTLAAIYASSLSRNTLQALAPAGLLILFAFTWLQSAHFPNRADVWRSPLVFWVVPPAMVIAALWLLWRNFQEPRVNAKMNVKNALVLAAVFLAASAMVSATYNRVWELALPLEAKPGSAKLSLANPPRMECRNNLVTVYLPDGRVWLKNIFQLKRGISFGTASNPGSTGGFILPGTNWLVVQDAFSEFVGIQTDGSLWASAKPLQKNYRSDDAQTLQQLAEMVRAGEGNDWKDVTFDFFPTLLIKRDGTLWHWPSRNWQSRKPWPGFKTKPPEQIVEAGSGWDRFESSSGRLLLVKKNGQVWSRFDQNLGDSGEENRIKVGNHTEISRKLFLEALPIKQFTAGNFSSYERDWLGIGTNGTFHKLGVWGRTPNSTRTAGAFVSSNGKYLWGPTTNQIQIGSQVNWLACAQASGWPVTLRSDGTLWRWAVYSQLDWPRVSDANSQKIGERSDWVAISSVETGYEGQAGMVTLAADGSLWLWRFEPTSWSRTYHERDSKLLCTSRRPQLLGNIFDTAE